MGPEEVDTFLWRLLIIISVDCRKGKMDISLFFLFRDESMFLCELFVLVEVSSIILITCSVNLFFSIFGSVEEGNLIEKSYLFFTLLTNFIICFRSDEFESFEVDRLELGSL